MKKKKRLDYKLEKIDKKKKKQYGYEKEDAIRT